MQYHRFSRLIALAMICLATCLGASGKGPTTGSAPAQDPGPAIAVPDAEDPAANIPPIDLPGSKPTAESAIATTVNTRSCDPILDMAIYRNLETYYCLQSRTANCQPELAAARKRGVALALATLATAVPQAGFLIGSLINDYPNAAAFAQAKAVLAKAALPEAMASNPATKELLAKAAGAATPRQFRALMAAMLKLNPEAATSADIVTALSLVPKARISGAAVAAGIGSALVVGVAANAIPLLFASSSTGCETVDESYISLDRANQCRPKYVIDENVGRFLMLPHDEKVKILNDRPAVCEYYRKFNQILTNWIKPTSSLSNIQCGASQSVSYEVDVDSSRYKMTTAYWPEGPAKSLQAEDISPKARITSPNEFTVNFVSDGKESVVDQILFHNRDFSGKSEPAYVKQTYDRFFSSKTGLGWGGTYRPTITSALLLHKLYSEVAKACCELPDDQSAKCIASVERPTAPTMRKLQESVGVSH
jgi:hypothetical protein